MAEIWTTIPLNSNQFYDEDNILLVEHKVDGVPSPSKN